MNYCAGKIFLAKDNIETIYGKITKGGQYLCIKDGLYVATFCMWDDFDGIDYEQLSMIRSKEKNKFKFIKNRSSI